jgi:hypothetical protein
MLGVVRDLATAEVQLCLSWVATAEEKNPTSSDCQVTRCAVPFRFRHQNLQARAGM